MAQYAYTAMDADGRIVPGSMEASNSADLELRLHRMELDLVDFRLAARGALGLGARKVGRKELINFCFHMEQMTAAGVPMLEGLGDLRDSIEHARFRDIVSDLIESIEGGRPLSAALANHARVFDSTFTSLIAAGESSGKLDEVLGKLSESLKWQDELAAHTRKIMIYPLVVAILVLAVTFFLMIFLVPQLTAFVGNMGGQLPLHTRVLIAVSGVFINYWYLILALPVMAWAGVRLWLRHSERARTIADGLKLRVIVIGPVLHKITLARFATYFGLMYGSGIAILDCIRLSEGIVNNRVIAAGLARAARFISEGQSVTTAFQNTGIFPPLVIRMLKVGEATGALDAALRNVSYFYHREVKETVERAQAMIEPGMTIIVGLLLGWIMLSVLGPIYDTISQIRI